MKRLLIAVTLLVAAGAAHAQETIHSYDSRIDIQRDGSVDVVESISVRAEGNQIRRGIYRDFPTRYRDRLGNRVRVDLKVLSVERNGVVEPWFLENRENGIRINTGNDNLLPVPADYTFTIHYRVTRELGFFADHDELYWNAIGTGWIFPIEKGTARVTLPVPVPPDQLHAEGYTGSQGSKGADYTAQITGPGEASYALTRPLSPYEGFTIVLTFPKGIIAPPTQNEKLGWFLKDNRGALVALAGFILVALYMVSAWRAVGRDPAKGIIIARYEPSEGHTPAGLRYMQRMGYDMRCFTGDVLALAVAGALRIHREDRLLKDAWSLENAGYKQDMSLTPGQVALHTTLFSFGNTLELKNTNASKVQTAREVHRKSLARIYEPQYFRSNHRQLGIAWVIAIIAGIAAFASSGGFAIPVIIGIMVITLVALIVFARLIKAPTAEGRKLLDEIEGLRLYMSVAERDELRSVKGPDEPVLNAERYEELLPYAVALDVEDAWTKKFTAAVGAAAAAQAANNMGWYYGRGPISNLGDFTHSIGSSLNSTISSASNPPGSSSGAGGGGSSGGGGGGGGGGGR